MPVSFRRFGSGELEAVARVFAASLNDLLAESGTGPYVDLADAAAWQAAWEGDRRSLFAHLAATEGESWLAEAEGRILGYARSILRDGHCQLTEFFVLPGEQRAGLGRELLARAFESVAADTRSVIATTRPTALARYLKAGVYPLCPIADLERQPEAVAVESDLVIEEMEREPETLEWLAQIDRALLGYRRDADHRWLAGDRAGFLYRRGGVPVGYGYVGRWSGPFALLAPGDFPAVLAHAESTAAARGEANFAVMLPLVNRHAADYLLARGFRFDESFMMLYLTDRAAPRLDRYLCAMPGFFT